MRIVPTRIHGVLDYLTGVLLLLLPRLMGWDDTTTTIMTILGVVTIIYSLLTHYELGALKLIPMGAHLVLDILSGLFLIAVPFLFDVAGPGVMGWFIGLGVLEVLAALMTETKPREHRADGSVEAF